MEEMEQKNKKLEEKLEKSMEKSREEKEHMHDSYAQYKGMLKVVL